MSFLIGLWVGVFGGLVVSAMVRSAAADAELREVDAHDRVR